AGAGAERLPLFVLPRGRGQDDAVADPPAVHRLGERDRGVTGFRRGAELDPGAAQGGAVEVHVAAAADDRGARLRVQARDGDEADEGGTVGGDRPLRRADLQRRLRAARAVREEVGVAVEAVLAGDVPGLDFD